MLILANYELQHMYKKIGKRLKSMPNNGELP